MKSEDQRGRSLSHQSGGPGRCGWGSSDARLEQWRKMWRNTKEAKGETRDVSTVYLSANVLTPHVSQPSYSFSLLHPPPSSVLTSADSALTEKSMADCGRSLQVTECECTAAGASNVSEKCKSRIINWELEQ